MYFQTFTVAFSFVAVVQSMTQEEATTIINKHNQIRSQYCADTIEWDNDLALEAQQWANHCPSIHSPQASDDKICGAVRCNQVTSGENVAWGYSTWDQVVDAWYSQVQSYDFNNPGFSDTTGHFTQLVWAASAKIGCAATVGCPGINIAYVCKYSPAGNVNIVGNEACMFRKNVKNQCEEKTCKNSNFFYQDPTSNQAYGCDELSCFGWCGNYDNIAAHNQNCCECGGGQPNADEYGNIPNQGECWEDQMCTNIPSSCHQAGKCAKNKCIYKTKNAGTACEGGFCSKYGECDSMVISKVGIGGDEGNVVWAYTSGLTEGCTAEILDGNWELGTLANVEGDKVICSESSSRVVIPPLVLARYKKLAIIFKDDKHYTNPVIVNLPDDCVKRNDCPTPVITNFGLGCDFNECVWVQGTDFGEACTVSLFGDWDKDGLVAEITDGLVCSDTSVNFVIPEDLRALYPRLNAIISANNKWTEPFSFDTK